MKKICLLLLLGIITFPKIANATLIQHKSGYGFTPNGNYSSLYLYEDYETGMPVFRIQFETNPEDYFNYEEIHEEDMPLNAEEIAYIKRVIQYITKGKTYQALDTEELLGVQMIIWDVWQKHTKATIKYNYLTTFYENDLAMIKELEENRKGPNIYSYDAYLNEPKSIQFLPLFPETYSIEKVDNEMDVEQKENTITFHPTKTGTFRFRILSSYYEEQSAYYKSNDTHFIALYKGGIENDEIVLNVKEKEKEKESHFILPIVDEGVTVHFDKDKAKENEVVTFTYHVSDDTILKEIQVLSSSGENITVENQTFVMPDEDVVVKIKTEKRKKHFIFTPDVEGLDLVISHEAYKDEILTYEITLHDDYELENLFIYETNGNVIKREGNTFQMPDCDVVLFAKTKKQEKEIEPTYDIYSYVIGKGTIDIQTKATYETEVSYSYQIDENEELVYLKLYQGNGEEIALQDHSFIMPNQDVFLILKTKEKVPVIENNLPKEEEEKEVQPEEKKENYEIPNTFLSSIFFLIPIFIVGFYFLLRK